MTQFETCTSSRSLQFLYIPVLFFVLTRMSGSMHFGETLLLGVLADATGPSFGYYPNATKSRLIPREANLTNACDIFQDTMVNITPGGRPHIGVALDNQEYIVRKNWGME